MTKPKTIEVDGVFDIETEDWSTFVLGSIRYADGSSLVCDHSNEDALVDKMLATKGTIWAHNGGKYDCLWLLKHLAARKIKDVQVFASGQRIVNLKVFDLQVRDSAALIPMKLEKAALLGNEEKAKTGLDCECGRDCGGYCAIRQFMPRAKMNQLREYLDQDCRATLEMLRGLKEYAEEKDLDLCGTIGASAWRCAARTSEIPKAKWKKSALYDFARGGYYGGRVQVFRPYADTGHRYDINSSYPAALQRTYLPTGAISYVPAREAREAFGKCREGIYEATVHMREMFVPSLPARFRQRIGYPVGKFRGVWTRLELAYAECQGAKILEIHRALFWEESSPLLRPFVENIMALRWQAMKEASQDSRFEDSPKKHPLCEWLKLYANSLTGKLAQHPESDNVIVNPKEVKRCSADAICGGAFCGMVGCCPHQCTGKCGKWTSIDPSPDPIVWTYPVYRISDCAHVHWAAYLTAAARVELHEEIISDGESGESVVYCDTDSCYAKTERTRRVGGELGEWAYEGSLREFVALAPKVYRYFDPGKDKYVVRAKGIPEAGEHWDEIASGQDVEIEFGVKSFRSAVRAGEFFAKKKTHRHINPNVEMFGDRRRAGDVTMPMTYEKVRALG